MDPIKELNNEHIKISQALDIFEIVTEKLEKDIYIPKTDLEEIISFLFVYTDKMHHSKEEDGLFAEMFKVGYSKEKGPVAMLLLEHYSGHHFIRNMSKALININKKASLNDFTANAREYISLLRAHIITEDRVIFPAAMTKFDLKTLNKISKENKIIESNIIEKKELKKFDLILKDLGKKYLKN